MKKTTKKISAAALALVMGATAFTGCSGSTNSTPGRNGQCRINNKRRSSYRQSEDNVF